MKPIILAVLVLYWVIDPYYFFITIHLNSKLKLKPLEQVTPSSEDNVTIQVPIFNSGHKLLPLLKSIEGLPEEVMVQLIDSSDDGYTSNLLIDWFENRCLERKGVSILRLEQKKGNKGWALNQGAQKVQSKYIMVLDDDNLVQIEQVMSLLSSLKGSSTVAFAQAPWSSRNFSVNWISGMDSVSNETEHWVEDKVRSHLKIPFTIHGQGFVLPTEHVIMNPWNDSYLSEDVHMMLTLVKKGFFPPMEPLSADAGGCL